LPLAENREKNPPDRQRQFCQAAKFGIWIPGCNIRFGAHKIGLFLAKDGTKGGIFG
jgi:hypothetical protein